MAATLCTLLSLAFLCAPELIGTHFLDVTAEALPGKDPAIHSMGASAFDADGDGDLDLVVAIEFGSNILLRNDGSGRFTDESQYLPPHVAGDHEDVAVADYDSDGDPDSVFYGEDDQVAAYFDNRDGIFYDVTSRLPSRGTANAVAAADVDADGDPDLVVGNAGPDFILINDGGGTFTDESDRLPVNTDTTQDIAAGDINGDGAIDLLFGNEDVLYLNDGAGRFMAEWLPMRAMPEETRDADLADVDNDGDLDIYLANVEIFVPGRDLQDRLLLNDGRGNFIDMTAAQLPRDTEVTMSAAFIDFDGDGDLDLLRGSFDLEHTTDPTSHLMALINDGTGTFGYGGGKGVLPIVTYANAFDFEVADFNGDGIDDVFVASQAGRIGC